MKRISMFVNVIALAMAVTGPLLAQSNPFVGTWKLNLAKSNFNGAPAPKSLTRVVQAQNDAVKAIYEGVAADGSRISYSFTTNYDGEDSAISGVGFPGGADTIASKRINASTTEATPKKAGKVVAATRSVVSKDGKTTTITSKGVDANGKPRNVVSVYDKQ